MNKRQFLTNQARALLLDRVIEAYDEMVNARDSVSRIAAAHKLISMATSLLDEKEVTFKPTLVYSWIKLLQLIGITRDKLPTFTNIDELLAWRFHDNDEVDMFIKALYLMVPLLKEAALISTAPTALEKLH